MLIQIEQFNEKNPDHLINLRNAQIKRAWDCAEGFDKAAKKSGLWFSILGFGIPVSGLILEELTGSHYGLLGIKILWALSIFCAWNADRLITYRICSNQITRKVLTRHDTDHLSDLHITETKS